MSTLLITDIKALIGTHPRDTKVLRGLSMATLPQQDNAWLLIEDGLIKDFGEMSNMPSQFAYLNPQISAKDRFIFPAWCDSHTHLVFAASREEEFVLKIKGQSYEQIAQAGGGILNSARKVQQATEDELFESAYQRL